ncbi:hypothetical protein Tco_1108375 [Tanacetum coccineum]
MGGHSYTTVLGTDTESNVCVHMLSEISAVVAPDIKTQSWTQVTLLHNLLATPGSLKRLLFHSPEITPFSIDFSLRVFPMMVAAARRRLFRYSDTVRLSQSDEVLKLKNFKKDATLKLFKSTNQERYEHVGPEVTSSQDGETRLCLVDDLTVLKITLSQTSQDKGTSSSLKSKITTTIHKLKIEVKNYELRTKDKA